MKCQDFQNLLHAYVDNELDLTQTLAVETHLRECAKCAAVKESLVSLRSSVRDGSLYMRAPAALEQKIRASLPRATTAPPRRIGYFYWATSVAAVILVGAATWIAANRTHMHADQMLASEVTSAHVRSLMAEHLWDVKSTDQHTVKPWFDGKLDFAPEVRDFAGSSFALEGGRLDYLAGRPVAALIYRHEKHFVNVFVWPAPQGTEQTDALLSEQGYNVDHFVHLHMNYWLVSDVGVDSIKRLAALLRGGQR